MRKLFLLLLLVGLLLMAIPHRAQTVLDSQGRVTADRGPAWSAYGTKTDTSNLQIQAAPGAGISVNVYMAYCINTSASTQTIAFIKVGATTYAAINCGPAAIYAKPTYFEPPLRLPPNQAVTMNMVASATTAYLFASGTTAR